MAAGSIVIDLLMRTGAFETDTKRAEARLKALRKEVSGVASDFGLSAVGIGAATTALLAWTKATVDGIDALNDFADATGTSVENASALEDVALRTGASLDTAQSILVKFNGVLKDVKAGSEAANILKTIGLNAEELKRIDPAEALRQTAVALSQFADDGAKARAVQELFGKSVKDAAPFLKDLAEQTRLVAKVTSEEAKAAEDFNKAIFELQKGVIDLSRSALAPLVKQMADVANGFKEGEKAGKSYLQNFGNQYIKWAKEFWGLGGRQGPVGGMVTEPALPSLGGQGRRPANEGGGGVNWELFEENRRKAAEQAEEAIRKAKEASRAAERAREKEKQEAWEIEKNNIMAIFEAESRLRQEGAAIYEATRTPLEQLNAEQERLARLLEQGVIDWDTYGRAVLDASEAYDAAVKGATKARTEMDEFSKNAAENMQRAFGDTFVDMMNGNFKSVGDGFVQMINRMVAEALAANLVKSLFGVEGQGGVGSGWLSAVGTFMGFAGAKAGGGDVMANQAYLVGEKGPEMFVPHAAGTVIPHDQTQAGAGAAVYNFNVSIPPSETRRSGTQIAVEAQRKLALGGRNL